MIKKEVRGQLVKNIKRPIDNCIGQNMGTIVIVQVSSKV